LNRASGRERHFQFCLYQALPQKYQVSLIFHRLKDGKIQWQTLSPDALVGQTRNGTGNRFGDRTTTCLTMYQLIMP
jgi:hypothetical protein